MKPNRLVPAFSAFSTLVAVAAALLLAGCAQNRTPKVVFGNTTINNTRVRLAMGTGGEMATLQASTAKRLGIGSLPIPGYTMGEEGNATLSTPLTLAIDGLPFPTQLPLMKFELNTLEPIDGTLSWLSVRDNILVFDAERRSVYALEALPAEVAAWQKLKIHRDRWLILETPMADGSTGLIFVSTLNSSGIALTPARLQQWRDAHPTARKLNPAVVKGYWAQEYKAGSLVFNGVPIFERTVSIPGDKDYIAVIGLQAIGRLNLVVDGIHGYAYVQSRPLHGTASIDFAGAAAPADIDTGRDWEVADNVRIDLAPIAAFASFANGLIKLEKPDVLGALADFARAAELDPTNPTYPADHGRARLLINEPDGALVDLNRALELDSTYFLAYFYRGRAKNILGDYPGAAADYSRFVELNPQPDVLARYERGVNYQLLRRNQEALADYDEALKTMRYQELPLGDLNRQILLRQLGRPTPEFADRVAAAENSWYKTLGQYLAGKVTETDLLAAAAKGDPGTVSGQQCEAFYYVGMIHLIQGDQTGAREFFQKSVATNAKSYTSHQLARAELTRLGAPATP